MCENMIKLLKENSDLRLKNKRLSDTIYNLRSEQKIRKSDNIVEIHVKKCSFEDIFTILKLIGWCDYE